MTILERVKQVQVRIANLSADEFRVVERTVSRLVDTGRPQYGPLDFSDKTAVEWLREALDEHYDKGVYLESLLGVLEKEEALARAPMPLPDVESRA